TRPSTGDRYTSSGSSIMIELKSSSRPARAWDGETVAATDRALAAFTDPPSRQLKIPPDHRDVRPADDQDDRARDKRDERQAKQQAAVPLYLNAEDAKVAHNRPSHHRHRQHGPERSGCGYDQQQRCDQFDDPGSDPPPGFDAVNIEERPDGAKDVDRFLGPGEFEEEGLQQDDRDVELQDPADNGLRSRKVVHADLDALALDGLQRGEKPTDTAGIQ